VPSADNTGCKAVLGALACAWLPVPVGHGKGRGGGSVPSACMVTALVERCRWAGTNKLAESTGNSSQTYFFVKFISSPDKRIWGPAFLGSDSGRVVEETRKRISSRALIAIPSRIAQGVLERGVSWKSAPYGECEIRRRRRLARHKHAARRSALWHSKNVR